MTDCDLEAVVRDYGQGGTQPGHVYRISLSHLHRIIGIFSRSLSVAMIPHATHIGQANFIDTMSLDRVRPKFRM